MIEQAILLHQKGRLDEAASLYRKILAQSPEHADVLHLLGVIEIQRRNASAGIELIERAIAIDPNNAAFFSNRGTALRDLKRFDDALVSYDRALALKPDYIDALNNRGVTLRELKRFDDALASFDRALAILPNHAEALNNRGNALRELKRFDDALASYDQALAIKPGYAEAHYNRGNALRRLKRFDDALASYDRALTIKPDHAEALNNRGVVLQGLKRLSDACASFDRALAIKPDYVEALNNRGIALRDQKRFDEALASYDRALTIKPDYPFLFGERLICKMNICDWRGIGDDFDRLAEKIESAEKASPPFVVLATPLGPALQRTNAEIYLRENYPENALLAQFDGPYRHDRVRLGYFSADFHNHAVSYLMAELFERHDRAKFEVIAFSFGPETNDVMRTRLEKSFDRFIKVGALSDEAVALLARSLEIDIAVDLMGFTRDSRLGIFALRAAPLQVSYLGYPGTMGAAYIDYVIADKIVIPREQQVSFREKIVYLPHSYLANDSTRAIADRTPTRAEAGLPDEGFVFCCFNNSYKLTPEIFTVWMRLLVHVEGSVLWLAETNLSAMRNLRQQAESNGVAANRICFAPFVREPDEHLARHRLADLFLDTLPYNAHTTAGDALWAGLPVLTCLGQTFPGRVAASLLDAVGLPEMITQNLAEYEALALGLAADPQRLLALRRKLAANRLTRPLFDTALFTKHIESAYVSMWQRHQAGLAAEHIHVQT